MAQIGTIKVETQSSGTVSIPVFETGDSGSSVYEFVRVQTASGTGFIPVVDPSDANFPYLRIQSQNQGVVAVHNDSSLIPTSEGGQKFERTINGTAYNIHIFESDGTFTLNKNRSVDALVVGGGGGGGGSDGGGTGGGGGGGVAFDQGRSLSTGSYSVTVGSGGTGADTRADGAGDTGNDSFFDGIQGIGGGGGGNDSTQDATNGGSGGGAGNASTLASAGTQPFTNSGVTDKGEDGGPGANQTNTTEFSGGGGGGATDQGDDDDGNTQSGNGGAGLDVSSTFTNDFFDGGYVGGGGGGGAGNSGTSFYTGGEGGIGGGGDGGSKDLSGQPPGNNGIDGTGGGGGGFGGDGGDGVVAIRVPK